MAPSLPASAWKTRWKVSYSAACASPSALASFAPSAVTAVENAGSSPGRPGGQTSHSASSRLRAARPAILRQKLIGISSHTSEAAGKQSRGGLSFGHVVALLDCPLFCGAAVGGRNNLAFLDRSG